MRGGQTERRDLTAIGQEILCAVRNELYVNLPFLDAALCALEFLPGGGVTATLATDGARLFYDGSFLAERYLRSRVLSCRTYLHVILHCMLRHPGKSAGKDPQLWALACDAAVESILDALDYPCLTLGPQPKRQLFYGTCRAEMKVLTAEGVYRHLLRARLPEYERAALGRLFAVDDHSLWDAQGQSEQNARQDEQWKQVSDRTRTAMETVMADQATGGAAVLEQVRVAVRDDVDYRAFLRRFAAPREVVEVDGDAFDYIFYTYGLRLYGNLPLVEPPETRETRRIEDFVIAVDTSMSTSGELVRQFLACTYAVLRSTETFTRKVNIRILQCDDRIRQDVVLHDLDGLRSYMEHFELSGGSATDFRPVFEHVERLRAAGAFRQLRGLLYFTDGMGIYPEKRPPWETAFILLEEPPLAAPIPPWAIRMVLDLPGLERTGRQLAEDGLIDLDDLPQL